MIRQPASGARGRPRRLYLPASRAVADGGQTGYELLSGILAAHWAGDRAERVRRAEQAGWAWAGQRAAGAATLAEAAVHVNAVFAELGVEPDLARDGDRLEIRLHACSPRSISVNLRRSVSLSTLLLSRLTTVRNDLLWSPPPRVLVWCARRRRRTRAGACRFVVRQLTASGSTCSIDRVDNSKLR